MAKKQYAWCAVPECTRRFEDDLEDRWLQWIQACGRLDLEPKGPEYANRNCKLCHLHFEKKWYNINKIRARLHPDAIPTIFFGPDCQKNIDGETNKSSEEKDEYANEMEGEMTNGEETNGNMECEEPLPIVANNVDAEIVKPSTSKEAATKSSEDSPRKKKLRMKLAQYKVQNKALREKVRRLCLREKKLKNYIQGKEEVDEREMLKKLGLQEIIKN
ncbi:52 kDa repressor of the inhibitor of the protein kinase-like [Nylanderia fulva]|uniref:52 kDa repressor of the inhibitor of the protein kinase-like n=1 Tax=Nylanderia fulva TaxID=613905 RepID=UPI0010FB220E|nr:52 kDa repressor of the inhibitor of the protein kinase-like [Nylanderia fulva]XP_029167642.1 52 kDa repressor of the inhibitor of the protein kinase-like [Nylanderia fulva]